MKFRSKISSLLISATLIVAMATPISIIETDAQEVNLSMIQGVNFLPWLDSQDPYNEKSLTMIADLGFNAIRIPIHWETYDLLGVTYVNTIEQIVKQAQNEGLYVIIDNHQWRTSSEFGGLGFPPHVIPYYPKDREIKFWGDFLANKNYLWLKQWSYFKQFVQRLEKYDNVLGFEILNEPRIYAETQFTQLGRYHTFMAKKIDGISDKLIFFDRPAYKVYQPPNSVIVDLEIKVIPTGVPKNRLVYAPHSYGELGNDPFNKIKEEAAIWQVPILIGEFGDPSRVPLFEQNGFGWLAWGWGSAAVVYALVNYENGEVVPTQYLNDLIQVMNE